MKKIDYNPHLDSPEDNDYKLLGKIFDFGKIVFQFR